MPFRTRALVLFALAAPAVALAGAALRPRPRSQLSLPRPAVELVDEPASPPAPPHAVLPPAPILPPESDDDSADPVTVRGQVVDEHGRPVPLARLSLRNLDGVAIGVGKADDKGQFSIATSTAGVVVMLAQIDDRRGVVGPFDPDGQPVRIVVARPTPVHGVVVDAHGVPIENATVTASATGNRYDDLPATDGFRPPEARTDSTGQFTLTIAAPGAWTITASAGNQEVAIAEAVQILGSAPDLVLTLGQTPTPPLADETADPDPQVTGGDYLPLLALHDTDDGRLVVVVAPGDGDLMPGDVIAAIDGHPARPDAWERLRGPEGSTVDLEIERPATHLRFRTRLERTQVIDDDGC